MLFAAAAGWGMKPVTVGVAEIRRSAKNFQLPSITGSPGFFLSICPNHPELIATSRSTIRGIRAANMEQPRRLVLSCSDSGRLIKLQRPASKRVPHRSLNMLVISTGSEMCGLCLPQPQRRPNQRMRGANVCNGWKADTGPVHSLQGKQSHRLIFRAPSQSSMAVSPRFPSAMCMASRSLRE
jgi:hypothetical protein